MKTSLDFQTRSKWAAPHCPPRPSPPPDPISSGIASATKTAEFRAENTPTRPPAVRHCERLHTFPPPEKGSPALWHLLQGWARSAGLGSLS